MIQNVLIQISHKKNVSALLYNEDINAFDIMVDGYNEMKMSIYLVAQTGLQL